MTRPNAYYIASSSPWTRFWHDRAHEPVRGEVQTDYLCARPTFWDGMGSAIDFWGSPCPYNYSESEDEADLRALWSDWAVVGQGLKTTMRKYVILIEQDRIGLSGEADENGERPVKDGLVHSPRSGKTHAGR